MLRGLLLLGALLLVLTGCGGRGGSPAEQIVGRWEGTFNNRIDFFPNGVFIQTNPSGNRFAGTYTLSEDGTVLSSESNGTASSTPVVFAGDTLEIFGFELSRAGEVAFDGGPPADLIGGSWVNSIGGTYDIFTDGTWASYDLDGTPSNGGRYAINEDGTTITFASIEFGENERPLLLVTSELLVFDGNSIYERVAAEPTRPFPSGFLNSAGEAAIEQISGVLAGEVRDVGPYSLVLHQTRRLNFIGGSYVRFEGEYLAIEFSVRNNSAERIGGPNSWRFAVLSAAGDRLNEEGLQTFGFAAEDADQLPGDCASSSQASTLLPISTGDLLPGAALRTWVLFQNTPGLEAADLQLEVQVSQGAPGLSFAEPKAVGLVTFQLNGAVSLDALPWDMRLGQTLDAVTIEDVAYSGAAISGPVEAQAGDPCSAEQMVTLTAVNQGGTNTSALPAGGFFLLDSQGRTYAPSGSLMMRSFGGEYQLGPREEKQIELPFASGYGVRDQAAAIVFVVGETWYQISLR